MSTTPAAQLARLKCTYPLWRIVRASMETDELAPGEEMFVATRGRRRLFGVTPADLELELIRTDGRWV